MIPQKDFYYYIEYKDLHEDCSYEGTARFTGFTKKTLENEILYEFSDLKQVKGYTNSALFSETDIIEEIKN